MLSPMNKRDNWAEHPELGMVCCLTIVLRGCKNGRLRPYNNRLTGSVVLKDTAARLPPWREQLSLCLREGALLAMIALCLTVHGIVHV